MKPIEVVLWVVSGVTVLGVTVVACIALYEIMPERVKYICDMGWSLFLIILLILFVLTGIGWAGYNLIKYIF